MLWNDDRCQAGDYPSRTRILKGEGVMSSVRSDRGRQSERASRAGGGEMGSKRENGKEKKEKGMHKINNISDTPQ